MQIQKQIEEAITKHRKILAEATTFDEMAIRTEKIMLKNILKRINNWYLEVFKDTTREPEEHEEKSNLVLIVNLPLKERIKFLFTNKSLYRLNYKEYMWIKRNVK